MNSHSIDTAIFFDIHRHPHQHQTVELDVDSFLERARQGQLFVTDTAQTTAPVIPDAARALSLEAGEWIDLEIALIWALTGKVTDKETTYPYRDVLRSLLKQYGIPNSFRISVLCAYLICAVRLKRNGWSSEDKNNIDDFREFCAQLLDPAITDIKASAFMCAHREADEEDANTLVRKLKTGSFVRVINVLRGIAHNSQGKRFQLDLYHLNQSKHSLLAIFPNIIFTYIDKDGLEALLATLGKHYDEIAELARQLSTDQLSITLRPTEEHIISTRSLCEKLGGHDWRSLTPLSGRQQLNNSALHEITEEAAMEEVARYMPEYGAVKTNKADQGAAQTQSLLDWYSQQEDLTPYAKALYETMFYYNWGRKVREENGLAIGIDRDHSDFQVRAFHAGYNTTYEYGSRAPVLYLRRSEREVGKADIHSLSLRQFWRYSADHKR